MNTVMNSINPSQATYQKDDKESEEDDKEVSEGG
jgi:hypothetical protein